jgi:hypothetical protein
VRLRHFSFARSGALTAAIRAGEDPGSHAGRLLLQINRPPVAMDWLYLITALNGDDSSIRRNIALAPCPRADE